MRTADGPGRTGPRPAPGAADRLRRTAARWEDALSVGLGLLVAIGLLLTWLAGSAAHGTVLERGATEATERTPVPAVVTERATAVGDLQSGQQALTVAWTAPDGSERTAGTSVPGLYDVGDRITVWTGPDGALTTPPATAADALTVGFAAGFMTVVLWGLLVLAAGWLGFRWTARRFAHAWELDWAAVEPHWSGRRRA
ncbi:hypothetical protein SAMN05216207_103633 [Pseudonocardia ammonioxydans]|uniref:Integral membrane protein n=1 Tax=Pseudonocardia ammonioxydans TaxID=260086 RepID=A0A1I5F9J3_PSUAM|nr:hypothetical protein [Pseudonocardia ammonioxydans]SFO20414.1 hypothetical protein SAMN05216207_103633 [Pseudonocardia ammonioxydans]